jgi:hypothetical protein
MRGAAVVTAPAAAKPPPNNVIRIDPLVAFRARADARAHLVTAGELDLHDAFDELQRDAERTGLIREYGQDLIQQVMAAAMHACGYRSGGAPTFKPPEPEPTPASTIEALMFGLRRGLSCLDEPGNRARLARCDASAMKQIAARLLNLKELSNGARPDWSRADVEKLVALWESVR